MTSVSLPNTVPSRATTLVPTRLGAAAFVLAGILFVLYPLLRPSPTKSHCRGRRPLAPATGCWPTCWQW